MSTRANHLRGFVVFLATTLLVLGMLTTFFGHNQWTPMETPDRVYLVDRGSTQQTTSEEVQADPFTFRRHAIVIGINDYEQTKTKTKVWPNLDNASPDAKAVANILEGKYGFKVTRLFDAKATRRNILDTLDGLSNLSWNDGVLIYYAGHGLSASEAVKLGHEPWRGDEGFWIPYDGTFDTLHSYVTNTEIAYRIKSSPARHILVISDTCYGGTLFDFPSFPNAVDITPSAADLKTKHNHWTRFLIASSGDNEKALDGGPGGHSVFTGALLDYLKSNPSMFTASELGRFVKQEVSKLSEQHVKSKPLKGLGHDDAGEFIFVHDSVGEFPFEGSEIDAVAEFVQTAPRGITTSEKINHRLPDGVDPQVQDLLKDMMDPDRRTANVDKALDLIDALDKVEKKQAAPGRPQDRSRPRVLSLQGMTPLGGTATPIDVAFGYYFEIAFQEFPLTIVNRERLDDILLEKLLSESRLAELSARLGRKHLLPAGFLVETERGDGTIFLRLIDVETTALLASFAEPYQVGDDPSAITRSLAKKVTARLDADIPIFCEALGFTSGKEFNAKIGRLHGLAPDTSLGLFEGNKEVAGVKISELGFLESSFSATWPKDKAGKAIKPDFKALRLEAISPEPPDGEEEAAPPPKRLRPGTIRPAGEL